jgi:hypothetical protein
MRYGVPVWVLLLALVVVSSIDLTAQDRTRPAVPSSAERVARWPNGRPRLFYFDVRTGLLLRVEGHDANGKVTSAVEYQDYREVDGVKVPFII